LLQVRINDATLRCLRDLFGRFGGGEGDASEKTQPTALWDHVSFGCSHSVHTFRSHSVRSQVIIGIPKCNPHEETWQARRDSEGGGRDDQPCSYLRAASAAPAA
jgi:hypothetical protein